ncbi:hypothetical protein MAR_021075, partial [Mya arenaria]
MILQISFGFYSDVAFYVALSSTTLSYIKNEDGSGDVTLNVPNIHTFTKGDAANNIYCSVDCWPGCVFTWTNLSDNQAMSSSEVLVFGTAYRNDA